MILNRPHCQEPGQLPDILHNFYGMPVAAGMVLAVCGLAVGLYSIGCLPTELRAIIGNVPFQIDEVSMLIARLFP